MDFLHNPDDSKPDHVLIADSLRIEISRALETLSEKEKSTDPILWNCRYKEMSLEEIGKKYDLTRERVRQIKEKAIRKLKVKSWSRNLVLFRLILVLYLMQTRFTYNGNIIRHFIIHIWVAVYLDYNQSISVSDLFAVIVRRLLDFIFFLWPCFEKKKSSHVSQIIF